MALPLIFGIGMNKTGTKSLAIALSRLGFPCKHAARTIKRVAQQNREAGRLPLAGLTDEYVAFADSPINVMFKELDEAYPGSKFILTVRDVPSWVISRIAQFGGTEKEHRRKWDAHVAAVTMRFAERPRSLLTYDICGGEGWQPICAFLGVPEPDQCFPHKNRTPPGRRRRAQDSVAAGSDARATSSR